MCRKGNMLYEIGAIWNVTELNILSVEWIVYINIEVTSNDEVITADFNVVVL